MDEQYKELLELYADVKGERDVLSKELERYRIELQHSYGQNTKLYKQIEQAESLLRHRGKKIAELEARLPSSRPTGGLAVKEIYYADEQVPK